MVTYIEKSVNSEKPFRKGRQPRAKLKLEIEKYWESDKTLFEIAAIVGCRQPTVKQIFIDTFGMEKLLERKTNKYKHSKEGTKNPMFRKLRELHHNWKVRSSDLKGYFTVVTPTWWEGTKRKRVFEHHAIACIKYGLTSIPKDWCVHHVDHNGENNAPNNLLLMTISSHSHYHQIYKRVTTSRKT